MKCKSIVMTVASIAASLLCATPLKMDWKPTATAPEAVARPYAGLLDKTLVVAGGSTYGETKGYSQTISTYNPQTDTWTQVGALPEGIAEGASVPVNLGSAVTPDWRLICVGGVTANGASSKAYLLKADGTTEALPDFPHGTLSMTAATAWDGGAVFACGLLNGQLTNKVFTLKRVDGKWTWGELPALPGAPRAQAVAAAQNGDQKSMVLVVYGGAVTAEDGKSMADLKGWGYTKNFDGQWGWKALENAPVSTIGATFQVIGDQHVLLIGGYNEQMWNRVNRLTDEERNQLFAEKPAAFNWNRTIWSYHAVTGKWAEYGEMPEEVLPRCGAASIVLPAVGKEMPKVLIVGGEVKPKVRTNVANLISFTRQGWAFSWVSWVVIGVYFLAMVGMAMIFVLRQKTADSYFRGGKSIPWFVAGMSIFATMLSSITFISIPTMTYIGDWRYFPMVLCILAMAPIAIYFYLPFFCRLNITSAYEYLEKRFNLAIRLFGSAVFNIFMVCRVAVVTLLPALALDAVTGIGVENCILICGVATILYCCVGGLDAVIWSDFVQGIVLLGGAVTVLVLLIMKTNGGFGGFIDIAQEHDKLRLLDFRFLLKEPVFWVVVIQGLVSNLSSYTSDQCVVQRYIACTNEKKAANSIWFNGVLSIIASVIFYAIGTALYTHYFSSPELMDVTMPKSDSVFPIFMAMELHPVIAGLVIAAIFAATISTLSANLTSASTAITTDFVLRFKPSLTGPQQVKCGRICVIVIGILGVGAALTLAQLPTRSLFDEFQKFIAMLTAGLTALFFMGIFMPRVGGIPAVVGLLANYFVCYGLDLIPAGSALSVIKPHPFVYGGIGLVICILVAWVLSFIYPNKVDTKGLTHFSRPEKEDEA